ncbi:MAG TPA: ATP-binding protein, partial [Kofleriaceae bacterium]
TNAELQGLLEAPFVEPDVLDKYVQDDMRVFGTGQRLDIPEEPMKWADGRTRSVHTVKSPIFGDDGTVKMMVAVIRDITDRKALEAEVHQSQKLESLGMLAAGMAHEINTPIQFIGDQRRFAEGAFLDILALVGKYQALVHKVAAGTATPADAAEIHAEEVAIDLPYLQEELATAFTDMGDGVGRVARLVQAFKEFGHPDEGISELVDVNAAIRRTVVVCTNEYRYHAELALDLGDIPPTRGNTSELQQVMLNLIVNAAHAIADLQQATRGKIEIATRCDETHVAITVRDTGCGIPEAAQSRVFDPFFTTKGVGRGTGQGLSIARILVEKHGGTIGFETVPAQGTTFTVKLPR